MSAFLRSLFTLVLLLAASPVGWGQDDDLTGNWYGPDGMTHSVRQVGKDVWWIARSEDGGKTFTSIFHGTLDGDNLVGKFADVPAPAGKNSGYGVVKSKLVVQDGKVTRIEGKIDVVGISVALPWSISRTKPEK
jgi:hypothetical protein